MRAFIFLLIAAVTGFFVAQINQNTSNRDGAKRFSGAYTYLTEFSAVRAYPYQDIPEGAWFRAYEQAKMLAASAKVAAPGQWEQIGPHNIGGRTLALAINPLKPATIYAGSASGGLWRSYTGGSGVKAWERVPTGYPVLGVGAIAIDNADTNTLYIGTGEVYAYQNSIGGLSVRTTRGSYGIGILKTTNNGVTWSKSLDWTYNQRRGVSAIVMHPTDRNTLFAATSEGIYRTTNAGTSWVQVHNVVMATDILINPANPNLMFASCGNLGSAGNGIYRSTNAGANWVKLTTGLPASTNGKTHLTAYAAAPGVVYASIGLGSETGAGTILARTVNNGDTWETLSTADYATYQGWYSHFVVVHPTDSSKILTGGIDVWKSVNGGRTLTTKSSWSAWTFGITPIGGPEGPANYSHADHHCYAQHPTEPNTVYFGNDGGVFKTTDFGETFAGCNGSYQSTQFYNTFGVGQKDSLVGVGGMQDNATAVYAGSLAWRRVLGGDGCCATVNTLASDTMFGSSQYLSISRSSNRGVNWSGRSPSGTNPSFNGPFALCAAQPWVIFAGSQKMHRSINGAGTWAVVNNNQVLNGDPVLCIAVSATSPDTLYVTTAPVSQPAAVFVSIDRGNTFVNVTGNLPDRYPVDVVVDPGNSATAYVAFAGYGTPHLYRTTNNGADWVNISSALPDAPGLAVAIDPRNTNIIYFGNDLGVFVSSDRGVTWNTFMEGLPEAAIIMDLQVSQKDQTLYAATHGNGVYRRKLISPITGITLTQQQRIATVEVYPNPATNELTITLNTLQDSPAAIELYSVSGELLLQRSAQTVNGTVQLPVSALPRGVALLRVTAGGVATVRKIVLR